MSDSDPRGPAERYGENPGGPPRRVDHRIEGEGRYAGERNDGVATGADEGRDADRPSDIPLRGWKAVGSRVVEQLREDHASLLAAGVAFKALLALFPAIIAALSIWGLVASPEQIAEQLAGLTDALPDEAAAIIEQQLAEVAAGGTGALSVALALSILVALWSASAGMAGLIEGCTAAYNEVDRRPFVRKRGLALLVTFGAIVFLVITLGLIAVLPAVLRALELEGTVAQIVRIGVWPALLVLAMSAFAAIYRYTPDRSDPQVQWVTWGAGIATLLWLAGSALFTVYVGNFGTFGATYGALAGVIVLMLWLYLSSFVVLLGAEINAELERQTRVDTTVGTPEPRGSRGAVVADATPDEAGGQRR